VVLAAGIFSLDPSRPAAAAYAASSAAYFAGSTLLSTSPLLAT